MSTIQTVNIQPNGHSGIYDGNMPPAITVDDAKNPRKGFKVHNGNNFSIIDAKKTKSFTNAVIYKTNDSGVRVGLPILVKSVKAPKDTPPYSYITGEREHSARNLFVDCVGNPAFSHATELFFTRYYNCVSEFMALPEKERTLTTNVIINMIQKSLGQPADMGNVISLIQRIGVTKLSAPFI